jgi:hypothetical protein
MKGFDRQTNYWDAGKRAWSEHLACEIEIRRISGNHPGQSRLKFNNKIDPFSDTSPPESEHMRGQCSQKFLNSTEYQSIYFTESEVGCF